MPRLVTLLQGFGILISKRQVVRLLIAGKQNFLDEARDVLRAGLTRRRGSRSTTPARGTKARTATAPRSATHCYLVRDHRFKEPPELPRTVARWTWRLRRQPQEALTYMRPRPRRPVIPLLSEHQDPFCRSGGLERTPGPARRLCLEGPSRSRADRHRRRRMGQRRGAWLSRQRRDRQRRCRPIQCRSSWSVLGSWRTPGSQARNVHRSPPRRAEPLRGLIWQFYGGLKAWRRHPSPAAKRNCRRGSTVSSARPASPPSIACWPASAPTRANC